MPGSASGKSTVRKVWPGRAEIGGGLDQGARHALEGGLRRQDHVRQPDIDEDEEGAEIADATARCRR